jgi:hypothetical protein
LFSCSRISFISVNDFDWGGTQDSLYNLKILLHKKYQQLLSAGYYGHAVE